MQKIHTYFWPILSNNLISLRTMRLGEEGEEAINFHFGIYLFFIAFASLFYLFTYLHTEYFTMRTLPPMLACEWYGHKLSCDEWVILLGALSHSLKENVHCRFHAKREANKKLQQYFYYGVKFSSRRSISFSWKSWQHFQILPAKYSFAYLIIFREYMVYVFF